MRKSIFGAILMFAVCTHAQTTAPRNVVFELFGDTGDVFQFYRTEANVDFRMKYTKKTDGFTLTVDPKIDPGAVTRYPPTSIYEYNRIVPDIKLTWTSFLCWPNKITDAKNEYFKSLKCNTKKSTCDIEFDTAFDRHDETSIPFSRLPSGGIAVSAKHMALALMGTVPNKYEEFRDLKVANLVYGRIAVSAFQCENSAAGYMDCSFSFERDQNPFPANRPWDDCNKPIDGI